MVPECTALSVDTVWTVWCLGECVAQSLSAGVNPAAAIPLWADFWRVTGIFAQRVIPTDVLTVGLSPSEAEVCR